MFPPRTHENPPTDTMSLEIILGPMFAGKSSAILQRVRRAAIISQNVFIVTCNLDTRYSGKDAVKTHNNDSIQANVSFGIDDLNDIMKLGELTKAKLIIIEEAQFFTNLYEVVVLLVDVLKKHVVVVGLDGDSQRKPFGQLLQLIPMADTITKLTALCKKCGDGSPGLFTSLSQASKKNGQICVGGTETYEALCRSHYLVANGFN